MTTKLAGYSSATAITFFRFTSFLLIIGWVKGRLFFIIEVFFDGVMHKLLIFEGRVLPLCHTVSKHLILSSEGLSTYVLFHVRVILPSSLLVKLMVCRFLLLWFYTEITLLADGVQGPSIHV
jgi:hypothetical protein